MDYVSIQDRNYETDFIMMYLTPSLMHEDENPVIGLSDTNHSL